MLNPEPIYLADKVPSAEVWLLYFTVEDAARCKAVTELVKNRESFDGKFTRAGKQKNKAQSAKKSER